VQRKRQSCVRYFSIAQLIAAAAPPEAEEPPPRHTAAVKAALAAGAAEALLTPEEAARRLGCTRRHLCKLVEMGRLAGPLHFSRKVVRYREADVLAARVRQYKNKKRRRS
jgi:excisionase family DNA binding protein